MSVRIQIELVCDHCLDVQDEWFWYVSEARASAKRDGWQQTKRGDFCPTCVEDAWERQLPVDPEIDGAEGAL